MSAVAPRVAIGVPLYNGSAHLDEALGSLLGQDYGDFGLLLVDDHSLDATPELAARYAERDRRVRYERNERRLGLIGTYVRAFERAREFWPSATYFAWGSDHDRWHPLWLGELVEALDRDPGCVLAYPRSTAFDAGGAVVHRPEPFETSAIADSVARLRAVAARGSAGYFVYGLMRREDLAACGVYRPVREPDRLLMAELALRGTFREIPHERYFRRRAAPPTPERQRAACFPDGIPAHGLVPWPLAHAAAIAGGVLRHHGGAPGARLALAARAAAAYAAYGIQLEAYRRVRASGQEGELRRLVWRHKRTRAEGGRAAAAEGRP